MKIKRSVAVLAAVSMICTSSAVYTFGAESPAEDIVPVTEVTSENDASVTDIPTEDAAYDTVAAEKADGVSASEVSLESNSEADSQAVKDETVYVIQNTDGSPNKIIVSDIFNNVSAAEAENNLSDLTNVQNVSDNCWQGNSDKELPVQIKITYTLDGEEISPVELAGKSGHVVIRFDYINTKTASVTVNDKEETINVPFAAITGAYLDNSRFSNIKVTNGYTFNDGDKTIFAGIVFPGLNDSISQEAEVIRDTLTAKFPEKADNINSLDFNFPDYIEISADTIDFQLSTSLTVVSGINSNIENSPVLSGLDLSGFDESLEELKNAMLQLADGSSELASGLDTLLSSCNELADGVSQLSSGLNTLAENNETLVSASETVFNSLLSTANSKLKESGIELPELTIENYGETLDSLLGQFADPAAYAQSQARAAVETAVKAKEEEIRSAVASAVKEEVRTKVTDAVKEEVWVQILSSQGMDAETYNGALAAGKISEEQQQMLSAALDNNMASAEVISTIDTKTDEQMAYDEVKAAIESNVEKQIESLVEENMKSDDVQSQISAGTEAATAGAESIKLLKEQLDSYNEFYNGLKTYTDGVASASDGAAVINDSMPALIDGVTQLHAGAVTISDALSELNSLSTDSDECIQNLCSKLEQIVKTGEEYTSYTDNPGNMNSKVKFIYRSESIG